MEGKGWDDERLVEAVSSGCGWVGFERGLEQRDGVRGFFCLSGVIEWRVEQFGELCLRGELDGGD
jgi:hypothetical protein